MFIDRVKKAVQTILNTDNRGNFTPSDYDSILYNVINEIYEGYLYEINRLVNRQNRGLVNWGIENLPDRVREKVEYYLTESAPQTVTSGAVTMPTDLRYLDTVYVETTEEEIEICRNMKEFKLLNSMVDITPTTTNFNPIGIVKGTTLNVAPTTITSVVFAYLRNPLEPKWTYTVVNNAELFNPSAVDFQDIDMHPSEEENIIRRVLLKFGYHLKEGDIQAVMQGEENTEFTTENMS